MKVNRGRVIRYDPAPVRETPLPPWSWFISYNYRSYIISMVHGTSHRFSVCLPRMQDYKRLNWTAKPLNSCRQQQGRQHDCKLKGMYYACSVRHWQSRLMPFVFFWKMVTWKKCEDAIRTQTRGGCLRHCVQKPAFLAVHAKTQTLHFSVVSNLNESTS